GRILIRPALAGDVLVEPARQLAGAWPRHVDVERLASPLAGGRLGGGSGPVDSVGGGGVEAVSQDPELEGVEKLVDLVPVPGHGAQVVRAGIQRDVPGQFGQPPVAWHVTEALAEGVARLAFD